MDITQRIAQFENMASSDPTNEMAHFSLGRAYLDAGRFADAATSFDRCIAVAPDMSKAYQLAGEAAIKAGQKDRAARVLQAGYELAALKGDLMPKKAIAELLAQIGLPVPEISTSQAGPALSEGSFICGKTGRPGTRLPSAPFDDPVGLWIFEHITAETWRAWIAQGTKVINELRLDLSREQDSDTYDRYMREYLGIDEALLAKIRSSSN